MERYNSIGYAVTLIEYWKMKSFKIVNGKVDDMDELLFGISGLPIGSGLKKFNYASGIDYIKAIGLDAMELLFVRSVNVTDYNKDIILKKKIKQNIYLSAHGSHYINLNANDAKKQEQSLERIIKGQEGLSKVLGKSLVFHPGFYLNDSKEKAYDTIKANLLKLPYNGIDYRLETTGRVSQFGSLEELVSLCTEVRSCKLCVDFSHIHARQNGGLKRYHDFANVLQFILDKLGRSALDDLHMHMGGINYNEKGEKKSSSAARQRF